MEEINNCRICKSDKIEKGIFNKTFYLSNLKEKIKMTYAICLNCQYIFQDKYVGDKFLNQYYESSPMYRNSKPTKYDIDSVNRQINFLEMNLDLHNISSCLEIGAHTGHFLKGLFNKFNLKIFFDELSIEACKILEKIEGFENFRNKNVKVDLVILRHVIEHINDLDEFMVYVDNSLNENGKIFIEVPDWSILDSNTDAFIFEHLSHFNDKCLIDFLSLKGYSLIAIEKSINKDDPATPNRVMRLILKKTKKPLFGDKNFVKYFKSYYKEKHDQGKINLNKIYSMIGEKKSVAFFPASNLSFSAILETDISKINLVGYFDSDLKKKGNLFLGFKVFSPDQLNLLKPEVVFIFSEAYEPEIRELIKKYKIDPEIYSYSKIFGESIY